MTDDQAREPGVEPQGSLSADDPRLPAVFGEAHDVVRRFADLLTSEGVKRGLIGPREVPRLWERHLVNSAAIAAFLPATGTLVDVGTGAGLPGVVLAAMRPDLHVVLLEPMERRVVWLDEVVETLGLTNAEVRRGRAEDVQGSLEADAVTARAVAPMDRLAGWTLPLLKAHGVLLAMKGSRAAEELIAAAGVIRSLGGGPGEVIEAPTATGLEGTTVVRVVRELVVPRRAPASKKARPVERDARSRTGGKGRGAEATTRPSTSRPRRAR